MHRLALSIMSKSMARIKQIIYMLLAMVGAGYLALTLARTVLHPIGESQGVAQTLFSPDGKYKAVTFKEFGGGSISPYCFDYVSVVPAGIPDQAANYDKYRIYAGSCHSLGFCGNVEQEAPILHWMSASVLEIVFDPTKSANGISELTFRGSARSGNIRIVQHSFNESEKGLCVTQSVAAPEVPVPR
jgi:hypothetical protein